MKSLEKQLCQVLMLGLEAEHCSEAIHIFCNKWGRFYRTVQNEKQNLALVEKAQWLASNPGLASFNKSKQRRCSKCNLPSHYQKSYKQMAEIVKLQSKKTLNILISPLSACKVIIYTPGGGGHSSKSWIRMLIREDSSTTQK